jgi:probable phosphoglycerate mutase
VGNGQAAAAPAKSFRLVLLVRHGQTTYNVEGRLPGQLPGIPLTDEGRAQAQRAAVALSSLPLSAVLSSPLERARETAEIIARGWALPVRLDSRLMDTDVRRWAGQKIEDVRKNDPAWNAFVAHPAEAPEGVEGVESFASVQQRVVAVVEDVRRDESLGRCVVLVAHADVVKLIVAYYTGMRLDCAPFLSVANASISALAFGSEATPHLLALNWSTLPDWLLPPPRKQPEQPQGKAEMSDVSPEHAVSPDEGVQRKE